MKTTDAQFIALQTAHRRRIKRIIQILPEVGTISDRDSATQIKITGDITSDISNGDTFIIPHYDFETEHVVTSAPSYSGGKTTLVCSASTFPSALNIVGLEIAVKNIVTDDLIKMGMGDISRSLEGQQLNVMIADDVDITLNNGSYTYYKNDGTGLLQMYSQYHCKITFYYQGDDTYPLYFGGGILPKNVHPDNAQRTVTFIAHGHLKGLEEFPAFTLSDVNGDMVKLDCIELVSFTAGDNVQEGIKSLAFNFIDEGIAGVEILKCSRFNPPGVKSLKFRLPDDFRFHDGAWASMSEESSANIADDDSNLIYLDSDIYDLNDAEIFINITGTDGVQVGSFGYPELVFNDGEKLRLTSDFFDVLHNNTSVGFTNETVENERSGDTYTVLDESTGTIYLWSDIPFYGVRVNIESSDLVGTVQVKFSKGYDTWSSAISVTDGTSAMTASGDITWTKSAVDGWRPGTQEPGGGLLEVNDKFGIEISLSAYTSGSVTMQQIKKFFSIVDHDGNELTFLFHPEKLIFESTTEDIIIRQVDGTWQACTWKQNITAKDLFAELLTATRFSSIQQDLSDLELSLSSAAVNVWGKLPKAFGNKRITAMLWDSANSKIWMGVENELWTVTNDGTITFIDELKPLGTPPKQVSIKRLDKNGSGDIEGVAWYDRHHIAELPPFYDSPGFQVVTFKGDANGIDTVVELGYGADYIMPCDQVMRKGKFLDDTIDYMYLGQITLLSSLRSAGENLYFPFPQILKPDGEPGSSSIIINNQDDILTSSGYFSGPNGTEKFLKTKVGHFGYRYQSPITVLSDHYINQRWMLGNPGFCVRNTATDKYILYQMQRNNATPADTNVKIGYRAYGSAFSSLVDLADSLIMPLVGDYYSDDVYYARVVWDDDGTDYSEFQLRMLDISTTTDSLLWGTVTDTAEAGQSITGDEDYMAIIDMIYNSTEDTIHGLMMNKSTFEYHYFVYDVTADEMYSTQTGSGFTFDKYRAIKNFTIMSNQVYAVVVDQRYRKNHVFLMKAVFASGTITLTKIDDITFNDFDHNVMIAAGTKLYGATETGKFWEYSTIARPFIQLADFGESDCHDALNKIVSTANMLAWIEANRKLYLKARNTRRGLLSVSEDDYIRKDEINPKLWQHKYDGVEVRWEDPVTGESGTELAGTKGWGKTILPVKSNNLIQNKDFAGKLATALYNYFSVDHEELSLPATEIFQLEMTDALQYAGDQYDINTAKERIIIGMDLAEAGPDRFVMEIKTLEKTS